MNELGKNYNEFPSLLYDALCVARDERLRDCRGATTGADDRRPP